MYRAKTGIVRSVDDLGRIVIPIELRKTMGIHEGDSVELEMEGRSLVITKYKPFKPMMKMLDDAIDILEVNKKCLTKEERDQLKDRLIKLGFIPGDD